jgi:hypothetical protein
MKLSKAVKPNALSIASPLAGFTDDGLRKGRENQPDL